MGHSSGPSSSPDNTKPVYVGYQAHPGYPPPPPPPGHGYNPSQYHHYNAYPTPVPNPYQQPYNNGYYYHHQYHYYNPNYPNTSLPVSEPHGVSSFGRLMLILLIVLLTSMFLAILVTVFLFGSYIPKFEVASLKVSNFSVANGSLSGTWHVNVSIRNVNKELVIDFDPVMSSIHYRDVMLASTQVKAFRVQAMQHYFLDYNMSAVNINPGGEASTDISEDLNQEVVPFNLRMAMKATFKMDQNSIHRTSNLKLWCGNLLVRFSPSGEGMLEPTIGNTCLLRIWKVEE